MPTWRSAKRWSWMVDLWPERGARLQISTVLTALLSPLRFCNERFRWRWIQRGWRTPGRPAVSKTSDIPAAKASVLGVGISATSYAQVAAWLEGWIVSQRSAITTERSSRYICVTSVHGVMLARSDRDFRRIVN